MRAGIMDIYAVFMVTTYSFFAFEQMCAMLIDLRVCLCAPCYEQTRTSLCLWLCIAYRCVYVCVCVLTFILCT